MAYDMVVDSIELDNFLKTAADKIRTKAEAPYNAKTFTEKQDFFNAIDSIKKGAAAPTTEEKAVNISENGRTVITPTPGKVISKVTINVNVPTGSAEKSNFELIEFVPPALPKFKNSTGTLSIWGWGVKEEAQAWNSTYYTFHGNAYASAIGDTDHALTLSVLNGNPVGIPEMTKGKCLAVLRIN